MNFKVKFKENNKTFKANFGEIHEVSDGGYDIGYQDGVNSMQKVIEEYDNEISLQNGLLENAISELNGKTDPELYENGYKDGFVEGEKSVVDLGKLCCQIKFNNLNLFGTKELVLNLDNVNKLEYLHYTLNNATNVGGEKNTTVEKLTVNCKKPITDMYKAFNGETTTSDQTLKTLILNIDTSQCTNMNNCFVNMQALETIGGNPLDLTNASINQLFRNCFALKDFRVVENSIKTGLDMTISSNLSKSTIESVVNGLSNEVSGKGISFLLKVVNKAFETSDGANNGASSVEWETLVNTKPNWTIALK